MSHEFEGAKKPGLMSNAKLQMSEPLSEETL